MQKHEYPIFYKLVFRYGNIPLTFLLLLYLIQAAINIDKHIIYLLPFIITLLFIYFLNKHYLLMYKILPYKIKVDEEKLVCSKFMFSNRTVTIFHKDVEALKGGVFEGKITGLLKVYDGKNKISIGFYNKLKEAPKLITIILSNVRKEIYMDVIKNLEDLKKDSEKKKDKRDKKKKS